MHAEDTAPAKRKNNNNNNKNAERKSSKATIRNHTNKPKQRAKKKAAQNKTVYEIAMSFEAISNIVFIVGCTSSFRVVGFGQIHNNNNKNCFFGEYFSIRLDKKIMIIYHFHI